MAYLKEIFMGLKSLAAGMGITFRHMFHKPVTVHYPYEEVATNRFKGPIAFTVDDLDGNHACIGCNACIRACPSRCMALQITMNKESKRVLTDFKVDYGLCSLCSICIDVCPTDALKHDSAQYAMAVTTRPDLLSDLLQPFRDRGVDIDRPIMTPAQKKAMRSQADPAPSKENPV